MPQFRYSAMTNDGQAVTGDIQADSRQGAIARLAQAGSFVTEIEARASVKSGPAAGGGWSLRRKVSVRSRAAMLQQLAVALQSGLPLLTTLRVVEQQAESPALGELTRDLAQRVQAGESLSEAMHSHPNEFSRLEVAMTRVGETAGVLEQTMGHLAEFARRDLEMREKVRSAATYPIFVLALALVSVVVILTWILPRIMGTVLENSDVALLPWPTRVLMGVSGFLTSYYGLIALVVFIFGVVAFRNWVKSAEGRLAFDRFKLRVPVLGHALRKISVARFARTLGTLSRSGIQIIEAMQVIRNTLGNEALAQQLDEVTTEISQGQSIAEPLRRTGAFPPLLIQVIAMGERTGKLDELLLQTADSYDAETTAALERLMTILPNVFIVCMALVVGFILAAVLLPIVSMSLSAGL